MNLQNSFVDKNIEDHSFYTTYEIEQATSEKFGKDYKRVPQGVLIRYSKDKEFVKLREPEITFTVSERPDYHYTFLMNAYFSSFLNNANYFMNYAKYDEAEIMINRALEVKPQQKDALQLLAKLNQLKTLQNQE